MASTTLPARGSLFAGRCVEPWSSPYLIDPCLYEAFTDSTFYDFACQGFALRRSVRRGKEFSFFGMALPCQEAGIFSDRMVRCSPPDRSRRVEFFA